ncbi:MAG: hypothetical protein ACLFPE_08340, partial [Bacteroidales bacterium]
VGEIRRDLAFHGDVLNTAARLEKLCKYLGKDLLITGYLEAEIGNFNGFSKEFVKELKLEGKDHPIKIFSVEER